MTYMKNVSTPKLIGALIVIVAIAAAIVYFGRSHGSSAPAVSDTSSATTGTSTDASSSVLPSSADNAVVYEVATAKKSYSQGEQFNILVTIINNTDAAKTFSFKNGCQGNYTIGGFDALAHTRCTPDATMFTVLPHDKATVNLTHYPSVYKIPVGSYTLHAEIIGYGGSNVPITITQ